MNKCTFKVIFNVPTDAYASELEVLFCHSYTNSCSNHHLDTRSHHVRFVTKMQINTATLMHIHPYVYCTFAGKTDTTGKYARIYIDSLNLNHRNTEPLSDFSGSRTGASERLCTPLRITSTVKSFVCVFVYVCKNILWQSNAFNGYKHFLSNRLIPAA